MREGTKATTSQAQSHIIKRPRLTKLLDDSGAKLILLVAPAGYGKTTLAREWTAAYRRPLAWYQVAGASADVAALATGLAVELDAAVDDGCTTSADRMATLVAIQQRADVLARALARSRSWPRGLVVVIDDHHRLAVSEAAAEFVERVTALIPAVFLIGSRTRPSWFASRQAIYGEVLEVGTAELSMTTTESLDVLSTTAKTDLRPSAVEAAGGWPVLIGLAARSELTEFPTGTFPHHLYEYLADDLLDATSIETKRALTLLALTGTNHRGLARELIGPSAEQALHEADQRGLLTLDGVDRFRLHPLVTEYLVEKLHASGTAERSVATEQLVQDLVKRRRWEECLSVAEALPEASAIAGSVLEECLQELLSTGRLATIQRWLVVAHRAKRTDPVIDLAEAELAFRAGDYERALAFGARTAQRSRSRDLRSRSQLVAGRAAQLGNEWQAAGRWFDAAARSALVPAVQACALWGNLILTHESEQGDIDSCLKRFTAADDGSVDHAVQVAHGGFMLSLARANIAEALEHLRRAVTLRSRCTDPLVSLSAVNQLAWVLVYATRYAEGVNAADQVIEEGEAMGLEFALNHGLIAKGRALVGLRRFAEAQDVLRRVAGRLRSHPDDWAAEELSLSQARLQISLGDLDRARDHLIPEPNPRGTASMRAEYSCYRALVDAASGRPKEARERIDRAPRTRRIEARSIASIAEAIIGTPINADAGSCELTGLDVVFDSGYLDAIVIGYRAAPQLVGHIASKGRHREALEAILLRSADEPLAKAAGLRVPKSARRTDVLSPRETEVYELMIQGRTNQQIARSLFITESTAKVHVRHIFEKLGVRSRVEAVRAFPASADT